MAAVVNVVYFVAILSTDGVIGNEGEPKATPSECDVSPDRPERVNEDGSTKEVIYKTRWRCQEESIPIPGSSYGGKLPQKTAGLDDKSSHSNNAGVEKSSDTYRQRSIWLDGGIFLMQTPIWTTRAVSSYG